MELSGKDFQVLETLDSQEISTQRQLAEHAGISLGQANYVLKRLFEKGLVKIGKFRRNPRKIGYLYLLTPKGIKAKSRVVGKFLTTKLREYNTLRQKLVEKLTTLEDNGHTRIIFVGPEIVKSFLDSIIRERGMNLVMMGHCETWQGITAYAPDLFDIAILMDGDVERLRRIEESVGISREKFAILF